MLDPLLCSVCLATVDARTVFVAVMRNDTTVECPATGAAKIINWFGTLDPVGLRHIEWAAMTHVLIPVAIWQGTPVCEPHLWELRDRMFRA